MTSDGMKKLKPVLLFMIVFPTIVTWVYFVLLKDNSPATQQTAYSIGKAVQFGIPIAWVWFAHRDYLKKDESTKPLKLRLGVSEQMWLGTGFGFLVVAAMFAFYFGFFQGTEIGNSLVAKVREKTIGTGVNTTSKFLLLGLFYAICHSFLEEYYWRWFVFGYLRKLMSIVPAIVISSFGFMAHHVILLAVFFGWSSPLAYLFAAGVGVGGAVWAWLYQSTGTLRSAWLSHLIVDAGIFSLGYFLIRDSLVG